MAALSCHADVKLCSACVGWLREKLGLLDVTPTLPAVDMNQSLEFYEAAGFDVQVYEGAGLRSCVTSMRASLTSASNLR